MASFDDSTMLDNYMPNLERMTRAICAAWPKSPDGCAAICMDRMGSIPPEGCRHASTVHGNRARRVLLETNGGPWRELVQPIVAKCELATKLGQAVTFKGEGAHAVGELMRRMASILDTGKEQR